MTEVDFSPFPSCSQRCCSRLLCARAPRAPTLLSPQSQRDPALRGWDGAILEHPGGCSRPAPPRSPLSRKAPQPRLELKRIKALSPPLANPRGRGSAGSDARMLRRGHLSPPRSAVTARPLPGPGPAAGASLPCPVPACRGTSISALFGGAAPPKCCLEPGGGVWDPRPPSPPQLCHKRAGNGLLSQRGFLLLPDPIKTSFF